MFAEWCLVSVLELTSEYSPNQRDRVWASVPPPWCLVPGAYFQIFSTPDLVVGRLGQTGYTCAQ